MVVWEMIRASGLVAFILVSTSVFLGIAVKTRTLDKLMLRALVFEAHRTLSLLAVAFVVLHVLLLLANRHVSFTLAAVLLPFASSWRPVAVALGTFSLYLTAALVASFYVRRFIGHKTWRLMHYLSFVVWVMALTHGIMAGSDVSTTWVQFLYLAAGCAIGFMLILRLLSPSKTRPATESGTHLL
jgi:predicted ferric reductase